MIRDTKSPLLELLNQRWEEFIKNIPDPTWHSPVARPVFTPQGEDILRANARAHAQADNSDPFAYGRAMRRQRSGEWLPSDVRKDASDRIHARVSVGIIIPFAMESAQ